jgi:hypothetical protein
MFVSRSERIVGHSGVIEFDGLSATRGSVMDPRFRYTSALRALYGKLACLHQMLADSRGTYSIPFR